jgi:hypothetical protein
MEKISVLLDPGNLNRNLVDFSCYLAELTRSELTAISLDPGTNELVLAECSVESGVESACRNRGVRMRIQHDSGDPLSVVLAESRFTDMLVVDQSISINTRNAVLPGNFIKEILTKSECPVVIAPYNFYGIEEILFAWDGSAAATFAIKQFSYLFPALSDLKLTIMHVAHEQPAAVVEKKKLLEFLQTHYSYIGFRVLEGKANEELQKFLQEKKNVFVVMGAYGGRSYSGPFKHSTADLLLQTVNLPVFIAHNC